MKIPLSTRPIYGNEEILECLDSLLTANLRMGKKVEKFERMFAEYIGVKYAVMVNSGSSANLLALLTLSNPRNIESRISKGDEVVVPAVAWSTTYFPIINVGAIPVLVDVDDSYNLDVNKIGNAITEKTKAIMPVHLLGNPCRMREIMEIAEEHELCIIEDCCEAHGAEIKGKKIGSFGALSTFSFFLSHHITTIEGGMILTNNEDNLNMLRTLRAHGWIRNRTDREMIAKQYSNIDERFLFYNIGFNLRPTEIQGAFGIHQLSRLEEFIEARRNNAEYFNEELEQFSDYLFLQQERPQTRHVWFGYPITVKQDAPFTSKQLVSFLESKGIETRPIMSGNMVEQPVLMLFNHKISGNLKNAKKIMNNSFFIGVHHGIREQERKYVVDCLVEFVLSVEGKTL